MGRECSMNLVSLVWLSMALMLACGGPGDAPDEGSSDTLPDEATGEQGTEAPVSDAPSSDASQTGEDDNAGALTQPAGPTEGTAGSRDTASGSTGRLRLSLSAVNSAGAFSGEGDPVTLQKQNAPQCSATYQAAFGHSGAPDSLTVYVRRISLASSEGAPAILFESDDAAGAPVALRSGKVDLSALARFDPELAGLVDSRELEDGTIETQVRSGRYDRIDMEFANRAVVQGCLSTEWRGVGRKCQDDAPGAARCEPMERGAHTFCTRAAHSPLRMLSSEGSLSRAEFVGGEAEPVEVPLGWWGHEQDVGRIAIGEDPDATVRYSFTTPTVEMDAASDLQLNLAIDLNTRLAFEANTRPDGTNPLNSAGGEASEHDKPFFYLRSLKDSSMAFLGEPGEIHGYEVDSCYFFQGNTNDARAVASWMTVIFDPDGNVMAGNVSPVDEAGYILLKGGIAPDAGNVDGSFDLQFCGGFGQAEGPTCSELRAFVPLPATGESGELPSDNMTPNAGPDSDRGNWSYTRRL